MMSPRSSQQKRQGEQDSVIEHLPSEPKEFCKYEREWKIKTNMKKFAVILVSKRKTHKLVIERRRIEYQDKAKIL